MRLMEDSARAGADAPGGQGRRAVRRRRRVRRPGREVRSAARSDAGVRRMRYRNARLVYDNWWRAPARWPSPTATSRPPTTCLLLGDSNAYFLARFMSECWRRLVLAHSPTLDRRRRRHGCARHRGEPDRRALPDRGAGRRKPGARCASAKPTSASAGASATRCCTGLGRRSLSATPVELMRARLLARGPGPRRGASWE